MHKNSYYTSWQYTAPPWRISMDTPDCVCVRRLYVLSRKARGNRPKSCHVQSKEQNIRFNSNPLFPQEITEKNPRNIFWINKFQQQNPQKREIRNDESETR